MKKLYVCLAFLLSGCLQDKAPPSQRCFHVSPEVKTIGNIMLNECTGETWLLVRTRLDDKGLSAGGAFTYRWYPLMVSKMGGPEISYGGLQ